MKTNDDRKPGDRLSAVDDARPTPLKNRPRRAFDLRTVIPLIIGLLFVFWLFSWFGRPFGCVRVFIPFDYGAMLLLPGSAFAVSRFSRCFPAFFVFGAIGVIPWVKRLVLHLNVRPPKTNPDLTAIVLVFISVLGMAVVCRLAAMVGAQFWDWRKPPAGFCRECRYNLTGNVSGICPECGTPAPADQTAGAE